MESKNSAASTTFKNLPKSERNKKKQAVSPVRRSLTQNIENLLPPLEHFLKMTMSVNQFIRRLKEKYLLTREDMAMLNTEYPLRTENKHFVSSKLDATSTEFFPKSYSEDSGNGGSDSSEEVNTESKAGEDSILPPKLAPGTIKWKDARSHTCSRCGHFFYTTSKKYITMEKCFYHPGKLQTVNGPYGPMEHSCCKMPNSSPGCVTADLHVWAGPAEPVVNSTYVETEPPRFRRLDDNYGVYSLDCEMSYTVTGLEVVKVTLVDITGKPVYNEFVKPVNEVVDFNTKFSGVDKEDFVKHGTKTLVQVQRDLKKFICNETVLIGHGLENDLKGLKMLHKTVVDTSFVFPHFRGLPYRRSLRNLAQCCLKKDIQNGENGHDPCEDARTCMDLMLFRLSKDFPHGS